MRQSLAVPILAVLALAACKPPSLPAARAVDWRLDPVQTPTARAPWTLATRKGAVTLTPRAAFDVQAVVASADRYRFDRGAFLAPVDLTLIWGELPAEPYRSRVNYGQITRYYFWNTKSAELDLEYIQTHSSNMHLIPANSLVRRALFSVGAGDEVRLAGLLVDATSEGGFTWHSSLTRDDSGPGACELIWVEALQVGPRLYR